MGAGRERSRVLTRDAHLSDDEAVAKMGHPGPARTATGFAWGGTALGGWLFGWQGVWVVELAGGGLLQGGDVHLFHRHHGSHGSGVGQEAVDIGGDDLPGEAEFVL